MEAPQTPARWIGGIEGGYLEIIDQQRDSDDRAWLVLSDAEDVVEGLGGGHVRRESAVEVAVAFGVAMAIRDCVDEEGDRLEQCAAEIGEQLRQTEPVEEGVGDSILKQMQQIVDEHEKGAPKQLVERLFAEAAEYLSG